MNERSDLPFGLAPQANLSSCPFSKFVIVSPKQICHRVPQANLSSCPPNKFVIVSRKQICHRVPHANLSSCPPNKIVIVSRKQICHRVPQTKLSSCPPNKIVIPTVAYPNSCFAMSDRSTCAAFIKESRMKFASAINFDRNSGERSGGICGAPFPQTKATRVSSQIQAQPFCSLEWSVSIAERSAVRPSLKQKPHERARKSSGGPRCSPTFHHQSKRTK